MENYEIAKAIKDFSTRIGELKSAINIDKLKTNLEANEKEMNDPKFWNDNEYSAKVLKQIKSQKDKISTFDEISEMLEELEIYFEMIKNEDEDLNSEIETLIKDLENRLSDYEVNVLLSHEYDSNDAIIEMHPGAGGTESQDWCSILYRMYIRFSERRGFKLEVLDYQAGDEAGIKSVTFIVQGDNAYGYLKSEQGVHRLVRISPFDSNSRRHTSFCSINITPALDEEVNVEIKPEDIRIDTYRSSGAGGQHVNTTDSAIRITHLKTGIVVTCQNERSQIQNRERAMQILKSKLYQLEVEEKNKKLKSISGDIADNSFGNQIRSYVFHPYSMIKDHRTNYEVGNVDSVMDGDLDGFINAYLKSEYNMR